MKNSSFEVRVKYVYVFRQNWDKNTWIMHGEKFALGYKVISVRYSVHNEKYIYDSGEIMLLFTYVGNKEET